MFAVCLLAWTIQQAILGHEVVGGDAAALPWSFFPSSVIVPWESGYTLYSANCYCGSPWTDLTTVWRRVSLGVGLVCGKCSSSPVSSTTKSWSLQPITKCPLDETQHQVSPQQRKPGKKPRWNPISNVQQPNRICRCHTGQKKNTILNDNFDRNKLEFAPWFSIRNRSPSVTNNKERRTLGRERESSSSTTDRSTERNSTP